MGLMAHAWEMGCWRSCCVPELWTELDFAGAKEAWMKSWWHSPSSFPLSTQQGSKTLCLLAEPLCCLHVTCCVKWFKMHLRVRSLFLPLCDPLSLLLCHTQEGVKHLHLAYTTDINVIARV